MSELTGTVGIIAKSREYANRFNSRLDHWRFLTGDEAKIREIGGLLYRRHQRTRRDAGAFKRNAVAQRMVGGR